MDSKERTEKLVEDLRNCKSTFCTSEIKDILKVLSKHNLEFVVEAKLPECPYSEEFFPTSVQDAAHYMGIKGISKDDISAISGTISRVGWNSCKKQIIDDEGYHKTIPITVGE